MMDIFQSSNALLEGIKGSAEVKHGELLIHDAANFRRAIIDKLIYTATFTENAELRELARWIIWEASQQLGSPSSSIQELYDARAGNAYKGVTVPAINIRGMTYDVARTIF